MLMLSKCYESTEVDRRTWLHVPSGKLWSTSSDTHQVVARYMKVLSVTVSVFKRRIEKKLEKGREKCSLASFGSLFLGLFYSDIRRAYAFVLYGRRGLVILPRRNFGRICAELWYSGPTWTKNSAHRAVPFLDFWVLEWYWNYNQLFWKLMKGIGCWIVGCIHSACFELTKKLFI